MKFTISPALAAYNDPQVGDVFPGKGGQWMGSKMWVVVARKAPNTIVCLGLDLEGNIVGAAHYNAHAMHGRVPIGRVEGLEELEFNVEPLP